MAVEKDCPAVMLEVITAALGQVPAAPYLLGMVYAVERMPGRQWGDDICGLLGAWELLPAGSAAGIVLRSEVSCSLH